MYLGILLHNRFNFFWGASFILKHNYMKPKKVDNLKGPSCGTCGTGYQTCCIGFAVDGYPCDCHLTESGSGTAGSNCGDCGTAFGACCIGYAADGYPCECDMM